MEASRNASRLLPFSSSSVKTGTGRLIAASANGEDGFGTWKAMVKATWAR